MGTFLVSVALGLSTAAILSLSAVAFTLEYAVSRVANFAHGEFLTIGAYAAYSAQTFFHQNVADAALIAAAAGMVAGLGLNAGLIDQFRGRTIIPQCAGPHFLSLQHRSPAALAPAPAGMVAGLVLNAGLIEQFRGRTAIT